MVCYFKLLFCEARYCPDHVVVRIRAFDLCRIRLGRGGGFSIALYTHCTGACGDIRLFIVLFWVEKLTFCEAESSLLAKSHWNIRLISPCSFCQQGPRPNGQNPPMWTRERTQRSKSFSPATHTKDAFYGFISGEFWSIFCHFLH